jgi:PEGA domain-containing protein
MPSVVRCGLALLVIGVASTASAQLPITTAAERDNAAKIERLLQAVRDASASAQKNGEWANALLALQRLSTVSDSAALQFNIGVCQVTLGRYVAARATFLGLAFKWNDRDPARIQARDSYLHDIEAAVVRVDVVLDSADTTLTVDGRPVAAGPTPGEVLVAGDGDSPPTPVNLARFRLVLDPGAHNFRTARAGYRGRLIVGVYEPGERAPLDLRLGQLPARLSITSTPARAIIKIDGREAGLSPISVERLAGRYQVELVQDGYDTYKNTLWLRAGQDTIITPRLIKTDRSLLSRWWFWPAAIGTASAIAGVVTYALTRSQPVPAAYDAGNTGWVVNGR